VKYKGCNIEECVLMTPTQIGIDTDWIKVHSERNFALALKSNGTIWGWGQNFWGQLNMGEENTGAYFSPVQLGSDTNWVDISTTSMDSYAIKSDGTLWTTGGNWQGGGVGITGFIWNWTQMGTDTDWVKLFTGNSTSFGVKENGDVYSWGGESYYQSIQDRIHCRPDGTPPAKIKTDIDFKHIHIGRWTGTGVSQDGKLYGWGARYDPWSPIIPEYEWKLSNIPVKFETSDTNWEKFYIRGILNELENLIILYEIEGELLI